MAAEYTPVEALRERSQRLLESKGWTLDDCQSFVTVECGGSGKPHRTDLLIVVRDSKSMLVCVCEQHKWKKTYLEMLADEEVATFVDDGNRLQLHVWDVPSVRTVELAARDFVA
jgi:hypothetical protein